MCRVTRAPVRACVCRVVCVCVTKATQVSFLREFRVPSAASRASESVSEFNGIKRNESFHGLHVLTGHDSQFN